MDWLIPFLETWYLVFARFAFVLLVFLIVWQLRKYLLHRSHSSYILAVLDINNGATRLPVMHYEITIGRSPSCDVVIPVPVISRQHAVLTTVGNGQWRIADTKSASGISVNGQPLEAGQIISIGDEIALGGMKMTLMPASAYDADAMVKQNRKQNKNRWRRVREKMRSDHPSMMGPAFALLNIFQVLALVQLWLSLDEEYHVSLFITFGFLIIVPWVYRFIAKRVGLQNIAAEATAFFLTTLGICTTASTMPSGLIKQLGAIVVGLAFFFTLLLILRNMDLVMKLRRYSAVISLAILALNIVLGSTLNGQRNWIDLGFMTIQPSEIVKVLFIFSAAATLQWLLTARNITLLTIYAVGCMGALFLMGDFGTAVIFFFTYLVLIFLTSGDIRAIILSVVAAGLGALLILSFRPYILDRFSVWGNAWEYLNDTGFQQTRTLMAIASGGLLGLGGGNGFLERVYASDTDLVFGVLGEEWGLLIAILAVSCYVLFLLSAIKPHRMTRSSYYVIAACAAASLMLFQASLNIFGATDVLPLTGVTLPFISNGGSSMVGCWGLLSFLSAALNYVDPDMNRTPAPLERIGRKGVKRR